VANKYIFTKAERWAVWSAHDGHCFWCEQPFEYKFCTIDHVIPEKLINEPEKLRAIAEFYKLDSDFSLNSFANWVPAHQHCNSSKSSTLFEPSPAFLFILVKVKRRAPRARAIHKKAISDREAGRILGALEVGLTMKTVDIKLVQQLVRSTLQESVSPPDCSLEIAASATNEVAPILLIGGWKIVGTTGDVAYVTRGARTGIAYVGTDRDRAKGLECPICGAHGPWFGMTCGICNQTSDPTD
jgi:hypothetical protein